MAASQRDTLLTFTALCLVRRTWAGSLLVGIGLNDAGRALALAALAAGAASIFLGEDPVQLREAQREGCCTCTVTSLDEALRIMKNEIRQGRAIAVALRGDPAAWLTEMVERGVQPEAFASARPLAKEETSSTSVLCGRGMQTLSGFALHLVRPGSISLEDVLATATVDGSSLQEQEASSLAERRAQDAALLDAIARTDAMGLIARQWLGTAPALFPRALNRAHWRMD